MDSGFVLKAENPKQGANILSKLFFGWMIKFCYKGNARDLKITDLFKTLQGDRSEKLTDDLERNWEIEVTRAKLSKRKPSLLRALVRTFFWSYMIYGIVLFLLFMLIRSSQPAILAYFIRLFSESRSDFTAMYVTGTIIILESFIVVFCGHHTDFGQALIGMRVRIAVSSLVYRKALKLNRKSLDRTPVGQILNMLSNDVNRFDMVPLALHYLWIIPFFVLLVSYLIWVEVGISTLAGVLSMVLLTLPGQGYLGKLASAYRLAIAEKTDNRVKLMREVVSGVQVIKMYAWEKPFELIIQLARKLEINVLRKAAYLRGVYSSSMVFIERLTLFLTIISYVLLGNIITADKVFSMAQFYNVLQAAMAIQYPMAITTGAETLVSISRLEQFLTLEEKDEPHIDRVQSEELAVSTKNVQASWTPESPASTLANLSLNIPAGTLCAVIGPIGSGKSSLLHLLLGELPLSSGTVGIGGTISYASQEPWLFATSVRNNILFGQEYNKKHYRTVVKVCALEKDFEQMPQGDQTLVGERGMSLSGGQRARINLARAVYKESDIYLMDDPLSAVDAHVGKHLFDECIVKHLKRKTRILVTHQLHYLKKADIIVMLNEGTIEATGTYDELIKKNLGFGTFLAAASEHSEIEPPTTPKRRVSTFSNTSRLSEISEIEEAEVKAEEEADLSKTAPFRAYVGSSGSTCKIITLIVVLLLGQIACSAADYWITYWTQQEALMHSNETETLVDYFIAPSNKTNASEQYYKYDLYRESDVEEVPKKTIETNLAIYIYSGLIAAAIVVTLFRSFMFFQMAMKSSENLHHKMFSALLKAPMKFFNSNPSGRILNRFSKDMGTVDEVLPTVILDAIQIFLVMTGILVMVTIANYYMVLIIAVMGVIFFKVRQWYVATARDVKFLEGITKSPVFSHLNSSLSGIITIRAFGVEKLLKTQFDNHQDVHTAAWYLTLACRECFCLWLDLLAVIFVAIVTYSFILLNEYAQVSGSLVGLAISQSLILTGMLQYGIRQTSEVVNQLTCVSRVLEYTTLENENATTVKSGQLLPTVWPNKGFIEFKNLSLKYSEHESSVLKNLNITIPAGYKIGVVGRTGAGKSSLISALFRLALTEGSIFIDDVDTRTVELETLRKNISIIPQEPVLFSASLRYNLDPFNEFDDDMLWTVLKEVELKDVDTLEFQVVEGGANFSLGQRQLICLARAILRNNKILILDEATANVDAKTDALIQSTIRKKFSDCTVLTIAHRLNGIMDSDKVLMMDFGQAVEFDQPYILLQNPDGFFSKMVAENGPSRAQQLRDISEQHFHSNRK